MKTPLVLASIVVLTACAVPALALAAYNDVTLTTDAIISVGGYTLDVSGSSATIQSITVNADNFSVTLGSGSAITVTSPTLQQLSSDVQSDVVSNPCTGSASSISLAYSGAGTVTNVITPSATVCSGSGSTPAPAPSGGGGGQIYGSSPTAPGYVNTNPTVTSTLIGVQTVSAATSTASGGAPGNTSIATTASSYVFSQNLQYRATSPEVAELQKYLNAHGFTVAAAGPGSPGNETDFFGLLTYAALVKFQDAHAAEILTPVGLTQGSGYFGPATRAFVNSN